MIKNSSVLVVGAGIAGLGVAYYLTQKGFKVTVFDRGSGEDNCSYGNAGMVVPSHIIPLASPGVVSRGLRWMLDADSPFYIKPRLDKDLFRWGWKFKKAATDAHVRDSAPLLRDLLLRNRELLLELEKEEQMDFGFRKNGLLMLCKTSEGFEEEIQLVRKANELGIPARVLSADETREMEPNIEMDIIGSTYFPKDAHFNPGLLMDRLKLVLAERGVEFKFNTTVTGLKVDGEHLEGVVTDGETVRGSYVILCAGAWTPDLTKNMKFTLPMQAGKGYSLTLPASKKQPDLCALLSEAKVSMTPMGSKIRFGGTMEIVGFDSRVNPVKLNALKKAVCSYFPAYSMDQFNGNSVWVGQRPLSPDGLPYVGPVDRYDNLFISTGHSMMGMSLGLVSGLIISELIDHGRAELSHPLIDPNRYA